MTKCLAGIGPEINSASVRAGEGGNTPALPKAGNMDATARERRDPILNTYGKLTPKERSKCLKGSGKIPISTFDPLSERSKIV